MTKKKPRYGRALVVKMKYFQYTAVSAPFAFDKKVIIADMICAVIFDHDTFINLQ